MVNSANAAFSSNQAEKAEEYLRRALALREQVVNSPDDPSLAAVLINLGAVALAKDEPEAEELLRRARRATVVGVGENHTRVLTIDRNLALFLEQHERLEEAETLLRNAVERVDATPGAGPVDTAKLEAMLGSVLLGLGRVAAARGHFGTSLEKLKLAEGGAARHRVRPVCLLARLAVTSQTENAKALATECREHADTMGKPRWTAIAAATALQLGGAMSDEERAELVAAVQAGIDGKQVPEYDRTWLRQVLAD